jgi:hypothetical protein
VSTSSTTASTSTVARRLGADRMRWAHWFADRLTQPLHNGDWVLQTRSRAPYPLTGGLVRDHPASYLDWFGAGWHGTVPCADCPMWTVVG